MPEIRNDNHKMSHGVTTLTYVGDYDGSGVSSSTGAALVGVAAVVLGSGIVRLAGAGLLAYLFANRK